MKKFFLFVCVAFFASASSFALYFDCEGDLNVPLVDIAKWSDNDHGLSYNPTAGFSFAGDCFFYKYKLFDLGAGLRTGLSFPFQFVSHGIGYDFDKAAVKWHLAVGPSVNFRFLQDTLCLYALTAYRFSLTGGDPEADFDKLRHFYHAFSLDVACRYFFIKRKAFDFGVNLGMCFQIGGGRFNYKTPAGSWKNPCKGEFCYEIYAGVCFNFYIQPKGAESKRTVKWTRRKS